MTKAEVIVAISRKTGLDKGDIKSTLDAFCRVIQDSVADGVPEEEGIFHWNLVRRVPSHSQAGNPSYQFLPETKSDAYVIALRCSNFLSTGFGATSVKIFDSTWRKRMVSSLDLRP